MAVAIRKIGESIRISILFPTDVANYADVSALIVSATSDRQIISYFLKSDIVIDAQNSKKCWIFIDSTKTEKGYENLYNIELSYKKIDSNFSSGFDVKKLTASVFKLSNDPLKQNTSDLNIIINSSEVNITITSEYFELNAINHDSTINKNSNPDFQHITAAEKTQGALTTGNSGLDTIKKVADVAEKLIDNIKLVCLGDSITEGNLVGGQYSYCNFHPFSTNSAINCGIGGTTLSTHQNSHYAPFSITELVKAIVDNNWATQDTEAEYLANLGDDNRPILARLKSVDWSTVTDLMIFSGTNDFGIALPNQVGDVTSTSNYTVFGAMSYIINKFSTAYPSIKLHFVTPIFRSRIVTGDGKNSDDNTNSIGLLLRDYANAIRYSCELNHIKCIDAHNMSGINKYTAPALLQDGLHPNQVGAKMLADVLWRGLRGQYNTSLTDNRLIKRYVLDANMQNVPISTDNFGRPLAIHNLKDIILVVDGECTATTSGALKIALNGVSTGYNTTGFADADGFALTVDGILDFEAYLRITKTINFKIEGYRAATLSPQVNPATQNLKGKNLSITSIISSITIFSSAKTLKVGTVIEIWKRY